LRAPAKLQASASLARITAHAMTTSPQAQPGSTPHHAESARGAQARDRMLLAALDLFGRHGFDATTTRMVAQQASMNLGAIPYYFGAKEDLYAQAAAFLADFIESQQRQSLETMRACAASTPDKQALIDLLATHLVGLANTLLADQVPASWVQFFLRAQTECHSGHDLISLRVLQPLQAGVCEVLAKITGRLADDTATRVLAFILVQQVMCLRLFDGALKGHLGWDDITPERATQVLDTLGASLRAQLSAMVPSSPTTA
jgi:AcrR family transcriptional regulator